MEIRFLLCFSIVLCACFLNVTGGNSRKDKDRKKDRYKAYMNTNPCQNDNRQEAPINCFCNPDSSPGNATRIECWIFNKDINEDYSIWNHFATQPRIQEMQTRVRPNAQFNFIPTKALVHLRNLKTFEVIYGSIGDVQPYAFANLTSLQVLKLTRNQIVNLNRHAFAHLTNLTELHLDENRIAELKRDVFVDLPSLQKFYIPNNNLSVIQEQTFRQLSHLLELELNNNDISILTKDIFTGLSELKRLDLSNNTITMLGDLTFAELWVLEDLQLESNQITYISDRAFAGLTHLKILNLAYNRLSVLSSSLDGLLALVHLDLKENNLETVTAENVHPFVQNLYNSTGLLNLSNNKLICDCRLLWMYNLKNETKSRQIRDGLEELVCYMNKSTHSRLPSMAVAATTTTTTTASPRDPIDNSYDYPSSNNNNNLEEYPDDEYNGANDDDVVDDDGTPTRKKKRLMNIQKDALPCPRKEQSTESPFNYHLNTPAYAEINSGVFKFTFNGGAYSVLISVSLLLT